MPRSRPSSIGVCHWLCQCLNRKQGLLSHWQSQWHTTCQAKMSEVLGHRDRSFLFLRVGRSLGNYRFMFRGALYDGLIGSRDTGELQKGHVTAVGITSCTGGGLEGL